MNLREIALSGVLLLCAFCRNGHSAGPVQVDVFRSGTEGYHTFRIPSVLVTPRGDLLAFCEGRTNGRADSGDIDLVMKRSTDQGATWSALEVIAEDGPNTFGNPCPVVDRATGTIWLLLCHNLGEDTESEVLDGTSRGTRTVWVSRSTDDGRTWSKPADITRQVKPDDWTGYATGPGVGIQLASGRLVVPCDHFIAGTKDAQSHVIYSDDHGATWTIGGVVSGGVNECQVAEIAPDTLILNMRNHPRQVDVGRAVAISRDGGAQFGPARRDPGLIEPRCQASLIALPITDRDPPLLLFSNPASTAREKLTVKLSEDGGTTWPRARVLHEGPSAYSCLTVLPNEVLGCLYERGEKSPYELITFARFPLAWLRAAAQAAPTAPAAASQKAEFEVVVESNVMVPMRDGVRLAVDLYRPARDGKAVGGKRPTLLARTPYDKIGAAREGRYYAERGYVVAANDVRGRYASEGTWRMMIDDPNDGYDMVEWIARQEWSDGKVGTFGTSYVGGTQHALAEMSPPHLTCMVPVDSLANCAIAGMRHGGAFELRFMNWIFKQGATNAKPALTSPTLRDALVASGERIREHADNLPVRPGTTTLRVVPEYESWLVEAMRTGPESPFWHAKGMSVVDHVADYADVPVLHVTGWYDSWTRQVVLNYEALSKAKSAPQRLLIGPWVHGSQTSNVAGEVEFTENAAIDLLGTRLRWYDRWLRGQRNGVDDDPPVWIYVMGTGDDSRSPRGRLRHGGFWRAERAWPIARAKPRALYLHADGSLSGAKPSEPDSRTTYTFDPLHPVPTIGGNISSNQGLMTSGGYDQRPRDDTHAARDRVPLSERRDVLVFRSEPLEQDTEVTGTVEVKLWVASTAPDTDFTAKLIDEVPPNPDYPLGFDLNLGDSILRARYREGLDRPRLMKPGEIVPLTITLYPTSNVFKKGHRIRVDISSSNYPRFDVNPNTGDPLATHRRMVAADNTIFHDAERPSHVVLPIVP